MNRHEPFVKERIAIDLKDHEITVLRNDGLYRHFRCRKPGTWCMGFDLVTWPGSLCFTGDMGEYLFQRTPDMVEFMRNAIRDVSYCAEKCVASKYGLKEWSEERFHENLAERLAEASEFSVIRRGARQTESVQEKIKEIVGEYENYHSPHCAERAMYESGLWDGGDLPSCQIYTIGFLWCVHALKWFTEKLSNGEVIVAANGEAVPA